MNGTGKDAIFGDASIKKLKIPKTLHKITNWEILKRLPHLIGNGGNQKEQQNNFCMTESESFM
ncbi:MAG: hypothetical protein CMC35_09500 [Flavobacteriaceae bacterium]|nr:hypothetical protein [Flavobacteriaceae bacterium]|tara:strand:+ start:183 stop:371 length:189 start_codon:yes stop_codon:yes gene_type:complete